MKSINEVKLVLAVLLFLFIHSVPSYAYAQLVVKGKIVDSESGEPIENANVMVINWKKGDRTNADGNYEIKLPTDRLSEGDVIQLQFVAKHYDHEFEVFYYKNSKPVIMDIALNKSADSPTAASRRMTEIYKIRHRNPQQIFTLIEPFLSSEARATVSQDLKTITINDRLSVHDKIGRIIMDYDIPLKKIWLEVTIIEASQNGGQREKLPADLAKVVAKLSSLFKFDSYEIVSRGDAMAIEESRLSFSSSTSKSENKSFQANAKVGFFDDVIRLDEFRVMMRGGNNLTTSLNIKDGETIVVGSSRGERDAQDSSLITVVKAKVVKE